MVTILTLFLSVGGQSMGVLLSPIKWRTVRTVKCIFGNITIRILTCTLLLYMLTATTGAYLTHDQVKLNMTDWVREAITDALRKLQHYKLLLIDSNFVVQSSSFI